MNHVNLQLFCGSAHSQAYSLATHFLGIVEQGLSAAPTTKCVLRHVSSQVIFFLEADSLDSFILLNISKQVKTVIACKLECVVFSSLFNPKYHCNELHTYSQVK